MLTPQEVKKLSAAFDLLESHGIHMVVPGWFDLSDADELIEYINDPIRFNEVRNPDFKGV